MTTYSITINEQSAWGENLINYLRNLPIHLTLSLPVRKRKSSLEKAMEEVARGKVNEYQSVDELFTKLGI